MIKPLYKEGDWARESGLVDHGDQPWRTPFSRDYARVIHSASFRRLQGKTQVFPGHESDFFRNRLTHSLEVAQIAEGIAERLNHSTPELASAPLEQRISTRLCATAALLHDLGHPPFGHNGERALDDHMRLNGGFESNAQSLKLAARLEKKRKGGDGVSLGFDLTFRSLAAIRKYDRKIPRSRRSSGKLVKGFYASEENLVREIRKHVGDRGVRSGKFKTIECSIMDTADDIAYSTYDLEDSLKAGFLTPASIIASGDRLLDEVAVKVSKELKRDFVRKDVLRVLVDVFDLLDPPSAGPDGGEVLPSDEDEQAAFIYRYRASKEASDSGYARTQLSSFLVGSAIASTIIEYNADDPHLSLVTLGSREQERVEVLKQYVFVATIYSSRVAVPEFRGYEVVSRIFSALAGERGFLLMPDDLREQYLSVEDHDAHMRIVSDFVASMTDRYAIQFYGRLHSDSAQSMFKPF